MSFKEDMKANNERFKQSMKAANDTFKKDIKQINTSKNIKKDYSNKWRAVQTWRIVALIIVFFPVGLYLLWRQDRWSNRRKKISTWATSAVIIASVALSVAFAPPKVTVTSSLSSVQPSSYRLAGKISPSNSQVTINGLRATVSGDSFSSNVPLNEGDNNLKVVAVSGNKRTEKTIKIHRYTKSEVASREKAIAHKKAVAAAAKATAKLKADAKDAKKKAADDAAAQAKQRQDATKKAKADADATAKAAKNKAAADAAAQAKAAAAAAAAVTVSQKNAVSKAKSYLSFSGFSHDGLVAQLEYEQFSAADATYGVDNAGADWNAQAAIKAKNYMSFSSFSRGSLISQLEYEKFTPAQAAYGASAVGL